MRDNQRSLNEPCTLGILIPTIGGREIYIAKAIESALRVENAFVVIAGPKLVLTKTPKADFVSEHYTDLENLTLEGKIRESFKRMSKHATYGLWIGDDDYLHPKGVGTALANLCKNEDAVMAFGDCQYIGPDGAPLFISRPGKIGASTLGLLPQLIPQPSCIFHLKSLEKSGALRSGLSLAFDLDLMLKLREIGRLLYAPEILSSWRWHPDSLTISNRSKSAKEAMMARRSARSTVANYFLFGFDSGVRFGTLITGLILNRYYLRRFRKVKR